MVAQVSMVDAFTEFVTEYETRLRESLIAACGGDIGRDAAAEALVYGWENWDRVSEMENPAGYLYTVGLSRGRKSLRTRRPIFDPVQAARIPDVEPQLPRALAARGSLVPPAVTTVDSAPPPTRELCGAEVAVFDLRQAVQSAAPTPRKRRAAVLAVAAAILVWPVSLRCPPETTATWRPNRSHRQQHPMLSRRQTLPTRRPRPRPPVRLRACSIRFRRIGGPGCLTAMRPSVRDLNQFWR